MLHNINSSNGTTVLYNKYEDKKSKATQQDTKKRSTKTYSFYNDLNPLQIFN